MVWGLDGTDVWIQSERVGKKTVLLIHWEKKKSTTAAVLVVVSARVLPRPSHQAVGCPLLGIPFLQPTLCSVWAQIGREGDGSDHSASPLLSLPLLVPFDGPAGSGRRSAASRPSFGSSLL
jgi:hypothetical protein